MVDLITASIAIFVVVTLLSAYGTRKLMQARNNSGNDASSRGRRKRSKGARNRDR